MESTRTVGEHHVTFHNQGLCHYSKGNLDIALENFRKALALNKGMSMYICFPVSFYLSLSLSPLSLLLTTPLSPLPYRL
jgi:hypothetical protein